MMNGDVGMGCTMRNIVETRPLAILSGILAQSCVTPPYIPKAKGVTHDCASIPDSIAKGLVSTIFRIVHPIPTSPFIQLNDFCTCFSTTGSLCSSVKDALDHLS